jgi:uncharacterized membrane protein
MKPEETFVRPVGATKRRLGPFRRAVLRGLGILLPPLLTIVILLWAGKTVNEYLLEPLIQSARWVMVEKFADIRDAESVPASAVVEGIATIDGQKYRLTRDDKFIPQSVYTSVWEQRGINPMPANAKDIYERYVNQTWLQRQIVVPLFVCVFLLFVYLLGKFLAAGIGRFFWNQLERLIDRVPLVRNVYSSVKQVTDFLFADTEVNFSRVAAIEYPRRGIWTLCFVTSDGLNEIRIVANEPVMTVFVPTSPMPFTGFALTVKKSEMVDLSITVDQAIQFFVSCGVVTPPPEFFGPDGTAGRERFALAAVSDDD